MGDRRSLILAVTVGTLAVSANSAALLIALSRAAPPQAAAFGIIGLTAAFIGLIVTILWACRREQPIPRQRCGRVSVPWASPAEDADAYLLPGSGRHSALALAARPATPARAAAAPETAPVAKPAAVEAQVIDLQEWLKTHRRQRVLA